MLSISAEQMQKLTQDMFFNRVRRFILENCKSEHLLALAKDRQILPALWMPVWNTAAKLSEHDCAVFLVMLGVCKCEGIELHSVDEMAGQVGAREVQLKKFFEDRGYFRFSDFDYPGGGQEGADHG